MSETRLSLKIEHDHARDYKLFRKSVQTSFDRSSGPLFETDVERINDTYMASLPFDQQAHNCTACRRFLNTYGSLVRVANNGSVIPVMWSSDDVPEFYKPVIAAMRTKLRNAKITGPFLSASAVLGQPWTDEWEHLSVQTCPVWEHRLLTPKQAAAAKKEDFNTVITALDAFGIPILDDALRLLKSEHLNRSEKFIAPVEWLRNLQDRPKGRVGQNLLWTAIALAPNGFCHPRASVVGSLLEDLEAKLSFDIVKARFNAKVTSLVYQRPQAAPSAGSIRAVEEIFEKRALAPSLERRYARLDECETVWCPKTQPTPEPTGGVFGHLKPKGEPIVTPLDIPAITMTWDKFVRTILPTSVELELHTPRVGRYIALTTAVHADAPMIMKWDNPVAWYVYTGDSSASLWGLAPSGWSRVTGVVPFPCLWGDKPQPHLGDGVVLTLEGAHDTNASRIGNGLFPETMRTELHAVRSVIEAYSRTATISGAEDATACGYDLRRSDAACLLRSFDGKAWTRYTIDRWD